MITSGSQPGRVALLTAGAHTGRSGKPMRWRALFAALPDEFRGFAVELSCDRLGVCQQACRVTGQPHPTDQPRAWYLERAYCDRYAEAVLRDLAEAGVTTVICSGLDTYQWVQLLAAQQDLRVIFDMHNVEGPLFRAMAAAAPVGSTWAGLYIEEGLRLVEEFEQAGIAAADELWTCSAADREQTLARYIDAAAKPIRVVPNAVDLDGADPTAPEPERERVPERVCFTGHMNYLPNYLAGRALIDDIAPQLAKLGCDLPVVLAGAALAGQFDDRTMPESVRLISDPESTSDIIAGGIMAVPLTVGGGSRLKVLEAFAFGAPVVSTAKGVEGLDVVAGEHYLRAETTAEFADAIVAFTTDEPLRERLVRAGRRLVRERYSVAALRTQIRAALAG